MSGTSADAIDAALVRIKEAEVTFTCGITHRYPDPVRDNILDLAVNPHTTLAELCQLEQHISQSFADAARALLQRAQLAKTDIQAIGSHGQTVIHQPHASPPYTLQLSDPSQIAHLTGIDTVADFRRADLAAGGQGAPLVPAFHAAVFTGNTWRVILNLGGIANITVLGKDQPIGFDTGPANTLLDAWCREKLGQPFDDAGAWARSGKIHEALLAELLKDEFFCAPHPKSTGPDYFNLEWLRARYNAVDALCASDVQRTLTELTAITVANAIHAASPRGTPVLTCGGGVQNGFLLERLAAVASGSVTPTSDHGIDCDYCEAMAFAWLAYRRKLSMPGNLTSVTGATRGKVLGGYFPAS